MKMTNKKKLLFIAAVIVCGFALYPFYYLLKKKVDFSADVNPFSIKNVIICHGGVRAKSGFSVLFRDEALAKTESGKPAIIPGDPDASELMRRHIY
jgi:hypothetical protein